MTHTPTLPNGFSRDKPELTDEFLDAATKAAINEYFGGDCWDVLSKETFRHWRNAVAQGLIGGYFTPGDAVLKELAEEGK